MSDEQKTAELLKDESLAKGLFLGTVIEEHIFPFPSIEKEEAETLRIVVDSIEKFMESKIEEFPKHDKEGAQPEAYIQSLRELGLFGVVIPEEFGGLGLSNSSYARVLQQTSRYDASTSLTIGAHSSIGMKGLLLFGNQAQKEKYLPKLASGEMIAAFCLTEPGSGSDAGSIRTSAKKQTDGSWVLNGEKIWITNGPIADFFTVFARTDSEEGKISAFIVERTDKGVAVGPKEEKMGIRASATSTVSFDNVALPSEALLGEEGKGFKIAMTILNNGRTGLGGGCVGGIKTAIKLAVEHADQRKQFGKRIAEFGLVKEKIARMTMLCFAAESMVNLLGSFIDKEFSDFSVEAAISKVFCSEAMWECSYESLQIAGGNGFMKEYPYERITRDSRINMIYEGTNEILRLYIALSGMKNAGAYLKDIGEGVGGLFNDPIKGFGVLSEYATKKFSQLTSIGRDKLSFVPNELREDAEVYETYTSELARATETILRRHGKDIIGKQFAMGRVANIVIDLVVGLAVLSRVSKMVHEKGADKCQQEIAISHCFAQEAKRAMNQNLRRIEKNEDELRKSLADFIVESGRYPWDVL